MTILRVAVPVPLPTLFDYLPPEGAGPPGRGARVVVPFGSRRLVGLVMENAARAEVAGAELKPVECVLDGDRVPGEAIELAAWCAAYYGFAPGEAVKLLLPGALRRVRTLRAAPPEFFALTESGRDAELTRAPRQAAIRDALRNGPVDRASLIAAGGTSAALARLLELGYVRAVDAPAPTPEAGPELNAAQRSAVAAILASRRRYAVWLLAGITGSGKTEVYLRAARRFVARGDQVLMLLPEIGLSPQLVRRIEKRLGERAWTYHSALSAGERAATWQAARDGRARVIVATRSGVFLPLARPGLIVVDEEHDLSFKQQDTARYHARDVAVLRAQRLGIPIVLGSATPSLESLYNQRRGRYGLLELPQRAGTARVPRWRILDARKRLLGQGGLSVPLVESIAERLERGEQVLLFRNRRGYAPVLMCTECGWQADCHRCSAHLTWHRAGDRLQCHHCGAAQALPARCPTCGAPDLKGMGAGTERLEEMLKNRFPDVPVHRVDRDSMRRRGDFERLLEQVRLGGACILVGTQMLAKGHHLPGITLAAALDVDQALYSADFRAPERLGQNLCQVAGRAGRGAVEGEFVLQTLHPDHAWLSRIAGGDYRAFAGMLLDEREDAALPPATALALLRAESREASAASGFLEKALGLRPDDCAVETSGPLPAILARRGGWWRYQVWAQSAGRVRLARYMQRWTAALHAQKRVKRVRWHMDMDPLDL